MSLDQIDRTLRLLDATPDWQALCARLPDCDRETAEAILDAANALATDRFAPYGAAADAQGCRIEQGRVITPDGSADLWRAYADGGWLALDLPEAHGGAGLPIAMQAAMLPLFERHAMPFMMGAGATRAAAHLLAERAAPALAAEWVPQLASGAWAATICISEPGAGSDVGRIRTKAVPEGDDWRITGEKIWISFGDHDLTDRIGHCLLARTNEQAGTRGLSLFLVPSTYESAPNGVSVLRIEEKMGLHGSPTCALSFENAKGVMIGEEGRGLVQLFTMIELMRLQTGCQGLGLATMACEVAEAYAQERTQGGKPTAPPVPIAQHAGVAKTLAHMRATTEALRAASLELAASLDASRAGDAAAGSFASWLLPLFKTFGGETAITCADAGIQVLGGAGYTREWPLERALRDARITTIYEGTTGIQALDFLTRRLWRDRSGLDAFLARVSFDGPHAQAAQTAVASFADLATELAQPDDARLGAAEPFMRAGWLAVCAWLGQRLDPREAAPLYAQLPERMALLRAQCLG